jgi:hypothetical protein
METHKSEVRAVQPYFVFSNGYVRKLSSHIQAFPVGKLGTCYMFLLKTL